MLSHEWALPDPPPPSAPVRVAIALDRTVAPVAGVIARRMAGLHDRALWSASPPRIRIEHAALDVAATKASVGAAYEVLAEVCRSRRTTPVAVAGVLASRRQARAVVGGRTAYRDVEYERHGLVVELDGRAYHDRPADRARALLALRPRPGPGSRAHRVNAASNRSGHSTGQPATPYIRSPASPRPGTM